MQEGGRGLLEWSTNRVWLTLMAHYSQQLQNARSFYKYPWDYSPRHTVGWAIKWVLKRWKEQTWKKKLKRSEGRFFTPILEPRPRQKYFLRRSLPEVEFSGLSFSWECSPSYVWFSPQRSWSQIPTSHKNPVFCLVKLQNTEPLCYWDRQTSTCPLELLCLRSVPVSNSLFVFGRGGMPLVFCVLSWHFEYVCDILLSILWVLWPYLVSMFLETETCHIISFSYFMGSSYLGLIRSPLIQSQTALGLNSSPGTCQLYNSGLSDKTSPSPFPHDC